jgi:23S rRNA (guanosine2251-2'-O)-methyltransferase
VSSSAPELLHGHHCVEEALRAGRRTLHRLLVRRGRARPEVAALIELAISAGVPVIELEAPDFAELLGPDELGGSSVQGAILEAGPLPELRHIPDLLRQSGGEPGGRRLLALDGVEDPQNVGALMRVADAAGASGLVLTERRAPPLSPALARASAGAIEWQPVVRVPNLTRALEELQQAGFWLVGAAPDAEASLFELPDKLLTGDLVVVLGAEGRGLRASIEKLLDHPIRIPMLGKVASLNVATAGAVVLYELLRRAEGPASQAPK